MISPSLAKVWSGILTLRDYHYKGNTYRYTRGQPMGTLSSWGSLALVHHYLVFLAAQRASLVGFRDYLVLGDDIVIANQAVAGHYQKVCLDYGITIGLPKSFVSNNGMFQFASQNFLGSINISPLSLKEVLSCSGHSYFFGDEFNLSRRLEWTERLLRRGYLNTDKVISFLRPLLTARENKSLSQFLFRGEIPSKYGNIIVTILSKLVFTKIDNSVSMDQFMCSLRTNIGLVDKTIICSLSDKKDFLKLYYKFLKTSHSKMLHRLAPFLNLNTLESSLKSTLPGTRLSLDQAMLQANSNSIEEFMSLYSSTSLLLKEIDTLKEVEKWEVLWNGYEQGGLMIGPDKLRPIVINLDKMESLLTRKALFVKVLSSVETGVPYLTKLQLSLLNELDSKSLEGTVIMGR